KIVRDNVSDPEQRDSLLSNIDRQIAWRAANEGSVTELKQALAHVGSNEEKAGFLLHVASNVIEKGDMRSGRQLLEEARGLIPSRAQNYDQISLQIQMAGVYSKIDPSQSLDWIGMVADRLNPLIEAASTLDGFDFRGGFSDGELLVRA